MGVASLIQFLLAMLLPVLAAMVLHVLERDTRFGTWSFARRQAVVGLVFGTVAVCGTEFGVSIDGATINVRDASPIVAGLLFGGPAGIVAGIIGGVERWFAALWGRGMFTRVACTVATIAAGFYAAIVRKNLLEGKRPTWSVALAVGMTAEVLHLVLVFITNMDSVERAFAVVRACALPMILGNGVAVMLSVIALRVLDKERPSRFAEDREISWSIQNGMLIAMALACALTSGFTYMLQTSLSDDQTNSLLSLNIRDVRDDIAEASDDNLLRVTHVAANRVGRVADATNEELQALAKALGVSEINAVDARGIIKASNVAEFLGFDMHSNPQSCAFLVLNGSEAELVQDYRPMATDPSIERKYAGVAIEGGFVQVGYDMTDDQANLESLIRGSVRNRHVGEGGFLVVADESGKVVSLHHELTGGTLDELGLGAALQHAEAKDIFQANSLGNEFFAMAQLSEGYVIVAALPVAEAVLARNVSVLVSAFMEIIVFAALFTVIYYLIRRMVVDDIHRVNDTLAEITDGNLEAVVQVRSSAELASLSDGINRTVDALKGAIAEASARIDAELEYARTIQRSALPRIFPPFPSHDDFEIFARMDAAKEVGGDFYDFYLLDDDRLAFLIADVSGKGIPGALFMMTAKTLIKSLVETGMTASEVFDRANDELCANNDAGLFVTCWLGMIDLRDGHVLFANAGHNPPAIRHGDGPYAFHVVRPNLVLAGMEGIPYAIHEFDMAPGDVLFLYTDGVTEATDGNDELFGDDRLLASLDAHVGLSMEGLCMAVHEDVDSFVGEAPQFDDITMLALRYVGRGDR